MPGLVNCHTHVGMSIFKGYVDEQESTSAKISKILPIEKKMTQEDIYNSALLSFIEMIKSGTTTFNDIFSYEDTVAKAAEKIGIRGIVSNCITGDAESSALSIKEAEDLYNNWNDKADGKIKVYLGLDSAVNCHPETIKNTVELAKKLNVPIHMHYLENKEEIRKVKEKYDMSVTDYLKDNNLFEVNTILAHGVWADELDLSELQFHNVSVINNPVSNSKMGSGIGDMKFLLEGGINVAIGSDGQECSGTIDMFENIKSCAYSQKVLYKDSTAITGKKVLEMATIKGAKALGLQKEIGTIEVGRKADLIMINLNKPHLVPLHNIYSTIAYCANGADVENVIINGKFIMESRKILTIDEEKIIDYIRKRTIELFE